MKTATPSTSRRHSRVGLHTVYRNTASIKAKPPTAVGTVLLDQELTEQLAATKVSDTQVVIAGVRPPGKQDAKCFAMRPSQKAVARWSP